MKSSTQDSQTITKLQKENKELKARLAKVQTSSTNQKLSVFKKVGIVLAIGLAGAMLVVGNLVFWTGRTLTDTNRYVQATQPIIQNKDVQTAIADKATSAIFDNIDVEKIAQDILPPKAQFLAPSFASQAESFTNQQIEKIVSSDKFSDTWQTVNAQAHQRLLNFVKNYQGDGTFDVNDLFDRITQNLQGSKLAFLGNVNLPDKIGSIQLISAPNLPKAHWLVVNLWWIRLLSIAMFVLLTILSIQISKNKRKTVIRVGILYALLMVASLLALRIARTALVNGTDPNYQSAVMAIWDIVLRSLVQQTYALAFVFSFVSGVAWFTGKGKLATRTRTSISTALNGDIQQAIYHNKKPKFALWMGSSKRFIEIILAILAGLSLLFISLTPMNILIVSIIVIVLVVLIEALGITK